MLFANTFVYNENTKITSIIITMYSFAEHTIKLYRIYIKINELLISHKSLR